MARPVRILHVDDHPEFAEVTAKFVTSHEPEWTVDSETHATDALDHLDDEEPDVDCIVSDYALPDLDGIEFLTAVREEDSHLPFILFTGKGSESVAGEALAHGATEYLQKQRGTQQYDLLVTRIRNAVERYRDRTERRESERYRRQLYRVTSDPDAGVDEKVDRLLELGCERLGVENGHVARVDRDSGRHEIRAATGSDLVRADTTTDLAETYCRATVERDDILTVHDATETGWTDDPAYDRWDIGCYIGGRIEVGSELYGTVCFVNRRPRDRRFTDRERTFVDLTTRWLSHAFERLERERERRRYETVARTVADAILVVDEGGRIASATRGIEDVLGYDPDALVGDPVSTLVGEDDDTIERALADGPSRLDDACEVSGRHAAGHAVALVVSLSAFEHRGDRFVVVLVRDGREHD